LIGSVGKNAGETAWYREVDARQWRVLSAAFLGWIFDGYEAYALFVVMAPALRDLLPAEDVAKLSSYAGALVAVTLLGWAVGGVVGGIAADYIGRKKTMMLTILVYALFTGLSGLSRSWLDLAFFRFLTGLGLGGEWATGATLIAETWPDRARAKGQGIMQSAFGWGSLLAALAWYFLAPLGSSSWRILFFLGVLPALLVLYIRREVEESRAWSDRSKERRELRRRHRAGEPLSPQETVSARFTVRALFESAPLRRLVLLCLAMSLATTLGFWAVSTWIPAYVETLAKAAGAVDPARWGTLAGLSYTVGAIAGYLASGFFADAFGRRALLAVFFLGSVVTTPFLYLAITTPGAAVAAAGLNGIFTLGQFAWMAIYPPELFPTAVRATATSLVFNVARFVSALGPLVAGILITRLGGFGTTAVVFSVGYLVALAVVPLVPETRGKALPS
jgi:MFS family permease